MGSEPGAAFTSLTPRLILLVSIGDIPFVAVRDKPKSQDRSSQLPESMRLRVVLFFLFYSSLFVVATLRPYFMLAVCPFFDVRTLSESLYPPTSAGLMHVRRDTL